MPFRFRKTIKISDGVHLNIGKRGTSLSLGKKGATVNLSSKGTRATVGIPGTGVSFSETIGPNQQAEDAYQALRKGSKSWVNWLSLFTQGIGLIISLVTFLASCAFALFVLYFLFSM